MEKTEEMQISDVIIEKYLKETRTLVSALKEVPVNAGHMMSQIVALLDNSKLLRSKNPGFNAIYKLQYSLINLYYAIEDKSVVFNDNIGFLIQCVSEKILEICDFIEEYQNKPRSRDENQYAASLSASEKLNVGVYLLYLDKAIAGEIFDFKPIFDHKNQKESHGTKKVAASDQKEKVFKHAKKDDEVISIKASELSQMVTMHEEMIARTYIINNQIESFKDYIASMPREARESYKLLMADCQNIQSNLLISHDKIISLIHDDAFLQSHQDFQGFFVMANGCKYLIPASYVDDVVSENLLNYEVKNNQKYFVYTQENESGSVEEKIEIPVYSLSSLFPGQSEHSTVLDTILLVSYQNQKIGIIVEKMLRFVSLIKKPMPSCFDNYPILQGVAFDEKYDFIPILHIPEIMKKFRALRAYDVKKFDVKTRKRVSRILVVDDSAITREIECTILYSNGFIPDEAFDGISAMERIHEKQFDLIITDDDMPRMNGEIFLDNLRRMENYAKVPVLAFSDNPLEKANGFICKSDFKRDEFVRTIKELL